MWELRLAASIEVAGLQTNFTVVQGPRSPVTPKTYKRPPTEAVYSLCFNLVVLASAKLNTPVTRGGSTGRPPRPVGRRRVTNRLRAEVVERYEAGESSRAVAAATGLARSTVLSILKQAGVERRPRGRHY